MEGPKGALVGAPALTGGRDGVSPAQATAGGCVYLFAVTVRGPKTCYRGCNTRGLLGLGAGLLTSTGR